MIKMRLIKTKCYASNGLTIGKIYNIRGDGERNLFIDDDGSLRTFYSECFQSVPESELKPKFWTSVEDELPDEHYAGLSLPLLLRCSDNYVYIGFYDDGNEIWRDESLRELEVEIDLWAYIPGKDE